jgi:hypothetical protein
MKKERERVKKSFFQNPAVLISAGVIVIFSAYFYIQKGGGSEPKPYEYNAATNQYWDPAHKHWHDGPPPPPTGAAAPASTTPVNSPLLPDTGRGPKPYQYNAATNQYWDPNHQHWHNGPPPPPESQKVAAPNPVAQPMGLSPGTPAPQPYEYDPVKNQYWDPTHGHWHNGRPPEPNQPPVQAIPPQTGP